MKYHPRPHFVDFHNRSQRSATIVTHRRAGKTVAVVNDVIIGALECPLRRPQFAYVGPTYKQTKLTAWQYMKEYAEPYLEKAPSESELSVTLLGNRKIFCLGSDNPDALRGLYLDGAMMDEYSIQKPSVFSEIVRPALSDRNGWWVFAGTPKGKNQFYHEYKKAEADPERAFSMMLRADESGIIPTQELEALRADMDAEEFAQEYLCSFDAALKGAIYADEMNQMFADGRLVQESLYDPALETNVVYDLGFTDATVATFWQEAPDDSVRVVKVHATTGTDIFQHIDLLHRMGIESGNIWLPHDARAKNLQTGMSIVEQFLEQGLRPQIVPHHKIRDRIAATRRLFPAIYIDENEAGDMPEALKNYRRRWNDTKLMFDDQPFHDWASDYADSFGYMAVVIGRRGARRTYSIAEDTMHKLTLENLFQDRTKQLAQRRRIS